MVAAPPVTIQPPQGNRRTTRSPSSPCPSPPSPPAPAAPGPARLRNGHCGEHQHLDCQKLRDWLCYQPIRGGCPKGGECGSSVAPSRCPCTSGTSARKAASSSCPPASRRSSTAEPLWLHVQGRRRPAPLARGGLLHLRPERLLWPYLAAVRASDDERRPLRDVHVTRRGDAFAPPSSGNERRMKEAGYNLLRIPRQDARSRPCPRRKSSSIGRRQARHRRLPAARPALHGADLLHAGRRDGGLGGAEGAAEGEEPARRRQRLLPHQGRLPAHLLPRADDGGLPRGDVVPRHDGRQDPARSCEKHLVEGQPVEEWVSRATRCRTRSDAPGKLVAGVRVGVKLQQRGQHPHRSGGAVPVEAVGVQPGVCRPAPATARGARRPRRSAASGPAATRRAVHQFVDGPAGMAVGGHAIFHASIIRTAPAKSTWY